MTALGWMLGTRWGRYAALGVLVLGMAWWAYRAAKSSGAAQIQAQQQAAGLRRIMEKVKADEAIRDLGPAARRERLRQWADGDA